MASALQPWHAATRDSWCCGTSPLSQVCGECISPMHTHCLAPTAPFTPAARPRWAALLSAPSPSEHGGRRKRKEAGKKKKKKTWRKAVLAHALRALHSALHAHAAHRAPRSRIAPLRAKRAASSRAAHHNARMLALNIIGGRAGATCIGVTWAARASLDTRLRLFSFRALLRFLRGIRINRAWVVVARGILTEQRDMVHIRQRRLTHTTSWDSDTIFMDFHVDMFRQRHLSLHTPLRHTLPHLHLASNSSFLTSSYILVQHATLALSGSSL